MREQYTLMMVYGGERVPGASDPCHCKLDDCRVRFVRFIDRDTVEVADNAGKVLPDTRHPSQLILK